MGRKLLDDLKWVSELDDIDHEICDTAREAVEVIERMKESLEAIRQWTVAWTWKDEIIAKCFRSAKNGLGVAEIEERQQALDELTEQAQDLDMGY